MTSLWDYLYNLAISSPIIERTVALDSLMFCVVTYIFLIAFLRFHPPIKYCVENLSVSAYRCSQLPSFLLLGTSHGLDLKRDTTP